jgi:hypothetical protein
MSTLTSYASASARDSAAPAASNTGLCIFRSDTKAIEVSDGTSYLTYNNDGVFGWTGSSASSMSFDGTDDRLSLSSAVTASATSGTISAWIKTTGTTYRAIFSSADTSGGITWGWMAIYNSKLRITFRQAGGTIKTADGSTTLTDGAWHHVMAVSSGTAYNLYVDGSAETLTNSNNDGTWFGDLTGLNSSDIGAHVRSSVGNYYNGLIDELAIWDSDQSSNISTIYNSGTPGNLSSLSPNHWYRMGDNNAASGDTIYDQGSGGVNATLIPSGGPSYSTDVA